MYKHQGGLLEVATSSNICERCQVGHVSRSISYSSSLSTVLFRVWALIIDELQNTCRLLIGSIHCG